MKAILAADMVIAIVASGTEQTGLDSRERAIETAASLFAGQGFVATGLTQVISESGTPKGSFYFNFPGGKEELGVEALRRAGLRLSEAITILSRGADSPIGFLRALVDALAAGLEASNYAQGCPIATVALETANSSESMRQAARSQFEDWEKAISAGLAGSDPPSKHDLVVASEVLMLLEGALLMAKVRRETDPVRSLVPTFEKLLLRR